MFPHPTCRLAMFTLAVLLGLTQFAAAQTADRGPDPLRLPPVVGVNSPLPRFEATPARPKAMLPLYSTLVTLQAADAMLTMRGLNAGAHELNPLMRNSTAMTVTKVATMATTVVIAEKMWKRNKPAAIAALIAANAVSGIVVARNARIVSASQR